jgi:hypothetical protein
LIAAPKCRSGAPEDRRDVPMSPDSRSKLVTFRVTFENSDRVERVRAEAYRSAPPSVEFVVTEGEGLDAHDRVVATFDGRQIKRITTIG